MFIPAFNKHFRRTLRADIVLNCTQFSFHGKSQKYIEILVWKDSDLPCPEGGMLLLWHKEHVYWLSVQID